MERAHTDEEIISKASAREKNAESITDEKIDIAVDLDDDHGVTHTYVVTFSRDGENWVPTQVSELSSL
ncbi:hypothetical protein BDE36_1533 [Arcticibacter tournemirensis]|uniref:Uncharacterized protein n=1 Tax=Arcticibacter tournemirensis TaxID=699437 RepID=A0A4V1KI86_9SPHI|nr:hypothetical protein [Arcticibacter tournemirensis]KAA8484367.1 hypothetical protein F1649_06220 [Arcticibacter tournemirensis]RXF69822.1 hypothetical protein EKH83_11280 [Arcticibacter tournemirensis]TQM49806.1 hypothetical protein BDE36_1533 [Arcticibacter tournemirensis]